MPFKNAQAVKAVCDQGSGIDTVDNRCNTVNEDTHIADHKPA